MKREIDTYELIENYLTGRLTEQEILAVEKRAKTDRDFARALEMNRSIHNLVKEGSLLSIRTKLLTIHQSSPDGSKRSFGKPGNYFWLATLLFIPIGILWFAHKQNSVVISPDQSEEVLFKTVNDTDISSDTLPISNDENKDSDYSRVQPENNKNNQVPEEIVLEDDADKAERGPEHPPEEIQNKMLVGIPVDSTQEQLEDNQPVVSLAPPSEAIDTPKCDEVIFSADISLEKSCFGKATGSIRVNSESIAGGSPPYHVSIDDGKNFYMQYYFKNLPSAVYSLWLKDDNNCSSALGQYRIESDDCSIEVVFAPEEEERWEVPSNEQASVLKIFNQQGIIVFQQQIEAGVTVYWDGFDLNGSSLRMGMYPFIIEFTDGQILTGGITIVR